MALPSHVSQVTMTATLLDDQGDPLQGVVTLTPSLPQVKSINGELVPTQDAVIQLLPRSIQLDEFGQLSVKLIPSNEPDIEPQGVIWTMMLPGEGAPTVDFYVPNDVSTGDISQYIIAGSYRQEPVYLVGYRGPKGDQGETGPTGPAGYDDTALSARVTVLENAGFLRRLIHDGVSYPARPAGVAAGFVEYVGPTEPTDWLTGDTWVEQV